MDLDAPRQLLLKLIEEHDTDLANVSRKIGRNHAYLHQFVKSGKPRVLPEEAREALAEYFQRDADDFRTGRARRTTRPGAGAAPSPRTQVTIDELDVRAGAGSGQLGDSERKVSEWRLPVELVRTATKSPSERLKILSVVGDSMEPTFRMTDRVMVDTADVTPSPPGIFVVWDGLSFVIKRVQFLAHSDPPRVRLSSDNKEYEAYERMIDEAYIQGRVLGKWLWT